jgi:hypothetical protein
MKQGCGMVVGVMCSLMPRARSGRDERIKSATWARGAAEEKVATPLAEVEVLNHRRMVVRESQGVGVVGDAAGPDREPSLTKAEAYGLGVDTGRCTASCAVMRDLRLCYDDLGPAMLG